MSSNGTLQGRTDGQLQSGTIAGWLARIAGNSRKFATDICGSFMITFALVLPMLLLGIGSAIDYGQLYSKRTTLQAVADNSALAGASELRIANRSKGDVEAFVESMAMANLKDMPGNVKFAVQVNENPASVTVELKQSPGLYFMDTFLGSNTTVISVSATARVSGSIALCVLGLDETAEKTVSLEAMAKLTAKECAVYSNSKSSKGLVSDNSAVMTAELICSSGGFGGSSSNYKPGPLTDCPKVEDPLASRTAPPTAGCDWTNYKVESRSTTLNPGIYCGGLAIKQNSQVRLNPGVYVIKDGEFVVENNSSVIGRNVGFYFEGDKARLRFTNDSEVALTAPRDGVMAGLLFFEARDAPHLREFQITSRNARVLVGTIYLPRGVFVVDADVPVADQSAYTAVIANRIQLKASPNLVINANYDQTDIPVAIGSMPFGGNVVLAK